LALALTIVLVLTAIGPIMSPPRRSRWMFWALGSTKVRGTAPSAMFQAQFQSGKTTRAF
jgi:hypothetical protein